MKKKYWMVMLAADGNEGGGGRTDDAGVVFDDDGGDGGVATDTPSVKAPEPAPWEKGLTQLTDTVSKLVAPKPAEQQKMTPEQEAEYWGVYNPKKNRPDFFEKWLRLPADMAPEDRQAAVSEREELFADMQKGMVRQAIIAAQRLMDDRFGKMQEEYGPIREHVETQRTQALRSDFFSSYPALDEKLADGKPKFARVIDQVAATLRGQSFASKDAYFKALAEGAAETVKTVLPDFDLGAKPTQNKTTNSGRLPRTSVGGSGGAARNGTHKADDFTVRNDIGDIDFGGL